MKTIIKIENGLITITSKQGTLIAKSNNEANYIKTYKSSENRKAWTKRDLDYLKQYKKTIEEIAEKMGRTPQAIKAKLHKKSKQNG